MLFRMRIRKTLNFYFRYLDATAKLLWTVVVSPNVAEVEKKIFNFRLGCFRHFFIRKGVTQVGVVIPVIKFRRFYLFLFNKLFVKVFNDWHIENNRILLDR